MKSPIRQAMEPSGWDFSDRVEKKSANRLEINCTMLAKRTDEVFRKLISFVDVAANFTNKAFFALCLRLRFYMFLIISISHSILITHNTGFSYLTDEHSVSAKIHVLLYFQGHKSINIFIQENKTIV